MICKTIYMGGASSATGSICQGVFYVKSMSKHIMSMHEQGKYFKSLLNLYIYLFTFILFYGHMPICLRPILKIFGVLH